MSRGRERALSAPYKSAHRVRSAAHRAAKKSISLTSGTVCRVTVQGASRVPLFGALNARSLQNAVVKN